MMKILIRQHPVLSKIAKANFVCCISSLKSHVFLLNMKFLISALMNINQSKKKKIINTFTTKKITREVTLVLMSVAANCNMMFWSCTILNKVKELHFQQTKVYISVSYLVSRLTWNHEQKDQMKRRRSHDDGYLYRNNMHFYKLLFVLQTHQFKLIQQH